MLNWYSNAVFVCAHVGRDSHSCWFWEFRTFRPGAGEKRPFAGKISENSIEFSSRDAFCERWNFHFCLSVLFLRSYVLISVAQVLLFLQSSLIRTVCVCVCACVYFGVRVIGGSISGVIYVLYMQISSHFLPEYVVCSLANVVRFDM